MSKLSGIKVIADKEVRQARLAECKACPHFKKDVCTACGCYLPFKTALIKPTCPHNKWKQ